MKFISKNRSEILNMRHDIKTGIKFVGTSCIMFNDVRCI